MRNSYQAVEHRESQSLRGSNIATYFNVISKEAKQTISHLRLLSDFISNNSVQSETKKEKGTSRRNKQNRLENFEQLNTLQKGDRDILEGYFQRINTNCLEITQSLNETAHKLEQFLTQQIEENNQHNSRRSFSAVTKQQERTRGYFLAEIFNFLNQKYFASPRILQHLAKRQLKKIAVLILQIESNFSIVHIFVGSILSIKPDITTFEPYDEKYKQVWNNVKIIEGIESYQQKQRIKQKIKEDYNKLKFMLKLTTAAVVTEHNATNIQFFGKIVFGCSFPRLYFDEDETELRCYQIWRNPEVSQLNSVWNLSERGAIKHCKNVIFQNIKTKHKIFIPVLQSKDVQKLIKFRQKNSGYKGYIKSLGLARNNQKFNIFQQLPGRQSISVLMLNSRKVFLQPQFSKYQSCSTLNCFNSQTINQNFETIIIHIHGGGFVALSHQTMQSYTRRWANGIQVPVFSINYRKPPQHRFPTAVYDCLSVYLFLVENIRTYMNISPKKIIIGGDSAGGNLACSLTALLMKMNYPILPSGIFLAYPALDMRHRYSPSRLNSFSDALLLPTLMLLCQSQYLGQNTLLQYQPLASPLLLNEQYIKDDRVIINQEKLLKRYSNLKQGDDRFPKKWPKTIIMVGKKDPLFDDSLRMLQRLTNSGVPTKMLLYRDFSHGFLNLDALIPSCNQAIEEAIKQIKMLIQGS